MKTVKARRILLLLLAAAIVTLSVGCGAKNASSVPEKADLTEVVEKLCSGIDVPPYETVALDGTDFEYFAFIPHREGLSAVSADALVNITPHSVVIIYDENGEGAEIADAVFKNADPNKWLCVGSEKVNVAYTDHYIVLIMSYSDTADAITENFRNLAPELDGMEAKLLTGGNSRYE